MVGGKSPSWKPPPVRTLGLFPRDPSFYSLHYHGSFHTDPRERPVISAKSCVLTTTMRFLRDISLVQSAGCGELAVLSQQRSQARLSGQLSTWARTVRQPRRQAGVQKLKLGWGQAWVGRWGTQEVMGPGT